MHAPTENEFNINALQRTYTGLLDDVMARYSTDYLTQEFFDKMIAKNVLFGGGMYINDGYLVNHPIARKSLYDEDSLLRVMIDVGFIQILTRSSTPDDFYQMPIKMAKQNIASFQELLNSEWEDFAPTYKLIADSAFFNKNVRMWPQRDMSVGFTKLMLDRAFKELDPLKLGLKAITKDDWLRIRDNFTARQPHQGGPRDKLEKAAIEVLSANQTDPLAGICEVMMIANQAYHYNFGLALTSEEAVGVAVDTTIGAAFNELLQTREIDIGTLSDIPVLKLPKQLPFNRGDLWLNFLRPATKVGQAKTRYISLLKTMIAGATASTEELRVDLKEATNEYISCIIDHLAPVFGRFYIQEAFDESISLAIGNLNDMYSDDNVTAVSAPTAGIAIEIQETIRRKGRQFLTERFKVVDSSKDYDPDDKTITTLGDLRPHIASLAFEKREADLFIEDIPPPPSY